MERATDLEMPWREAIQDVCMKRVGGLVPRRKAERLWDERLQATATSGLASVPWRDWMRDSRAFPLPFVPWILPLRLLGILRRSLGWEIAGGSPH